MSEDDQIGCVQHDCKGCAELVAAWNVARKQVEYCSREHNVPAKQAKTALRALRAMDRAMAQLAAAKCKATT